MKFTVVVLACVMAAAHAQFQRANAYASFNKFSQFPQKISQPAYKPSTGRVYTPAPPPVVYAKVSSDARNAVILKSGSEINPDGSYSYYYETDNGIAAQEQGSVRSFGRANNVENVANVAQGSYSWTSPEGVPVAITYVADENGYQPQGNAIPTPPPVPEAILRSLEYIRTHPSKN